MNICIDPVSDFLTPKLVGFAVFSFFIIAADGG
jgi:hypothetical protein